MDHPERLVGALQFLELQLATYEQQHLQQKGINLVSCTTSTGYNQKLHDQLCYQIS